MYGNSPDWGGVTAVPSASCLFEGIEKVIAYQKIKECLNGGSDQKVLLGKLEVEDLKVASHGDSCLIEKSLDRLEDWGGNSHFCGFRIEFRGDVSLCSFCR